MKSFLLLTVIQDHIETARHGNDELMQTLVCVSAALGPARNVVEIIDPLDLKGHVSLPFNKGEIASWIIDFGEVDNPAFVQSPRFADLRRAQPA